MENLFREQSEWIRIYMGTEAIVDPYEKTTETTMLNPLPVRAIVADLTSTQMQWKTAGIVTENAKEIIIPKKYENHLIYSQKIKIRGDFYYGWRTNSRLNYRVEGNYIRCYVYYKKV